MIDPGIGLDQGGNPLQEGVWAQTDGGWQPSGRRDESFASVMASVRLSDAVPMHHFSMPNGMIHNGNAGALAFFGAHVNGAPVNPRNMWETMQNHSAPYHEGNPAIQVGVHDPSHEAAVRELIQNGHAISPSILSKAAPKAFDTMHDIVDGISPAPPHIDPAAWQGKLRPREIPNQLEATHKFIVDQTGAVHSAPEPVHHEDIANANNLHAQNYPHGMSLGVLHNDDSTDWLQHSAPFSHEMLGSLLHDHFGRPINVGKPEQISNEQRFNLPGAGQKIPEHMDPEKYNTMREMEKLRGRPYGWNDNPYINRGGSMRQDHESRLLNMEPYMPWQHEPEVQTKIAGPAAALAVPALEMAGPALMRGALMQGGGMAAKAVGQAGLGGGAPDGAGQAMSTPPAPRDLESLSHVTADLETPHGNPGYYHDNPEEIDTHEFNDGDHDPNQNNPNNDASGASGEDNVPGGFGPNSPGMERMKLLAPLVLHHYNSEESGQNDPMLKALHEQLEQENPGYLDRVGPEHEEAAHALLAELKKPEHVHAHLAYGPGVGAMPGVPGQIAQQPGMLGQQPGMQQPGLNPATVGSTCPFCGGVTTADGSCPQCGAKVNGMGGAMPGANNVTSVPPAAVGGNAFGTMPRSAADHQGPVTDEQKSAVAQVLIEQGRHNEIPQMLQEPWNYSKELDSIQGNPNTAPNVDPNEQPPPAPAQEVAPPGATMPVPNPADPSGGAPMMASVHEATPHNGTPRCPKCQSATTGFVGDEVGNTSGQCHACGNIWSLGGEASGAKVAADGPVVPGGADPQVQGVPAADQQGQENVEQEQDSSHTWQTDDGQPLSVGQEYQMSSPGYEIPDLVKVEAVKPDSITVSTIGEYSNTGDAPLSYSHEITSQEAKMDQLSFSPSDGKSQAGDQSLENYQNQAQAPVNTEPTAVGTGADVSHQHSSVNPEHFASESDANAASVTPDADDHCPKCKSGSESITSSMSSETTNFHECYKCGNAWETQEEDYSREAGADLSWINEDSGPGGDDFFAEMDRHKAMRAQSGSRSLSDIASRDPRLQEIKSRLDENAQHREAGKKFTPREQREFIDESGVARNADKLDLEGTHYEAHRHVERKPGQSANGMDAPDEHLFMGFF